MDGSSCIPSLKNHDFCTRFCPIFSSLSSCWCVAVYNDREKIFAGSVREHASSIVSEHEKTQFRRGAKVGSRKRGHQGTEQLAKGMVQLHLAREREMKTYRHNKSPGRIALHLAREREMKTSKRRVAKISVVVEPKGSAFFVCPKTFSPIFSRIF